MKISVILPTVGRNSLDYAIDSIQNQTYRDLEIIIVDDSIDQEIVSDLHKVLKTGGEKGVSFARNVGVERAHGEFIAFLDDDDAWSPGKLSNQMKDLEGNNIDVHMTSALVNGKLRPSRQNVLNQESSPFQKLYGVPHLLRSRTYLPTASYLIRKEIFTKVKFSEQLVDRENILFLQNCFELGYKLKQNKEPLVEITFNKSSSLSRMSLKSEVSWLQELKKIDKNYASNFALESSRNFCRRYEFANSLQMLKYFEGISLKSKILFNIILLVSVVGIRIKN